MLRAARFDEQRLNGNPRRISGINPKALVSRKIETQKLAPLNTNNGIMNALEDVMKVESSITNAEEKVLIRTLLDFMADFVDADFPIHPGALVYDPITGEDITFAEMFRIVRFHKR